MRYAVTGATVDEVKAVGGKDVTVASNAGIIFATLSPSQVDRLISQGFIVRKVGKVSAPVTPPKPVAATPRFSLEELVFATGVEDLRRLMHLYGEGLNIAIIDTGIRETHENLRDRVIYSKNYTDDPMEDGYNHGTGVASIITAVAPRSGILNLKVLGSDGEGTEEDIVMAMEDCISMQDTEPETAPYAINLSLGAPDTADCYNPMRVACRAAIDRHIWVIAAAGNDGPQRGTIICPSCEEFVVTVGACNYEPFIVSDFSSRGPTKEGLIKPDMLSFGENIVVASNESDTATVAKSGTSFSTPFVTGLTALGHELRTKGASYALGLPEEAVESLMPAIPIPGRFTTFHPRICTKPEGVAPGKDNDYGWGLILADLAYKAMTEELRPLTYVGLLEPVTTVVSIGLVGMMMISLIKTITETIK